MPPTIAPREIDQAPPFSRPNRLRAHVCRHVLRAEPEFGEDRAIWGCYPDHRWAEVRRHPPHYDDPAADDERWEELLTEDLVVAARVELRANGWGPECEEVAEKYLSHLRRLAVETCALGERHLHVWQQHEREDGGWSQEVEGWSNSEKIFFSASARVRFGALRPYRLATGYRTRMHKSDDDFHRWVHERGTMKCRPSRNRYLLCDHA